MKLLLRMLAIGVFAALAVAAEAREVKEFDIEAAAQKHCPKDDVVWSNVKGGGIFHVKGSKLYGKTSDGGYLCRKEAEAAGWKEYGGDQPPQH